jgi:hypothetical protein
MAAVTKIVGDTMQLAAQRKIEEFTVDLCELMIADDSIIQEMFQRAAMLEEGKGNESEVLKRALEFNSFNKKALGLL